MWPFKAGVSNSNWSEGHILEIKCFAGRSLPEKKLLQTAILLKSPQNKVNLIKKFTSWNFFEVFAGGKNAFGGPHV
jgi:hypothetical protein